MGKTVKKRWITWVPLGLAALLLGMMLYGLDDSSQQQAIASQWIDKPLPAFDLPPATEGVTGLSSKDLASGQPRILNIFASWCIPCAAEAPALEKLKQAGVTIDAIAIRDRPEDVARFLSKHGNPYARIGSDMTSSVQIAIGSSGVPESFLIDGNGVVREQIQGVIVESDIPRIVAKLDAMK